MPSQKKQNNLKLVPRNKKLMRGLYQQQWPRQSFNQPNPKISSLNQKNVFKNQFKGQINGELNLSET